MAQPLNISTTHSTNKSEENSTISTPVSPVICQPYDAPPLLNSSGRVISVTSTIPYELNRDNDGNWQIKTRRGNSALYSALSFLATGTEWDTVHIGWTGEIGFEGDERGSHSARRINHEDIEAVQSLLDSKESECGRIEPVWIVDHDTDGQYLLGDQSRWEMYAFRVIWPLLHYILPEPSNGRAERRWWSDYVRMNQAFADKVLETYQRGDIVWIHDYWLALLPQILRQRLPQICIGLFVHAPFPSSEYIRCVPQRRDFLEGMLGANMIGFQNYAYSRHFISSCTRVVGFESTAAGVDAYGAKVAVDVFPIGIDVARIEKICRGQGIEEKMKAIKALYSGVKLIVGRDRLDSVRGVYQKLRGFEMFLDRYPEWRGKVVLIQVTSPGLSESTKLENKVSDLISHINGVYGDISYSPVQHYAQHIEREEYYALLRVADLGLITSVRDSMNTTSFEFVVCQRNHNSPVILSEFTGTASSLADAMQINPWDTSRLADAIREALVMPESQKREIQQKLYRHVAVNTVQAWVSLFLRRLLTNASAYDQSQLTPLLDKSLILSAYRNAGRRLFMFDYDGTLTPIVREPSAAIPTDRVIRSIKKLAKDPLNHVWIISGRDQKFLETWLGDISELGLSAEHGAFVRMPNSSVWKNLIEKMDMSWQEDVYAIFKYFSERTQGAFIERKLCALTWHYRQADPEYGKFQARECQAHLENTVVRKYDVEVMVGKANLEVRPTFVNKGEIVKKLLRVQSSTQFILCAGDDKTDEDMFRVLRKDLASQQDGIFTVAVGASSKLTLAAWHVLDPADVISMIGLLVGIVQEDEFVLSHMVKGDEAKL